MITKQIIAIIWLAGIIPGTFFAAMLNERVQTFPIDRREREFSSPRTRLTRFQCWGIGMGWPVFYTIAFFVFLPDWGRAVWQWVEHRDERRTARTLTRQRDAIASNPLGKPKRELLLGKRKGRW